MRPIAARVSVLTLLLISCLSLGRAQQSLRAAPAPPAGPPVAVSEGELRVAGGPDRAPFPLKHTDVRAEISGSIAQVRVDQVFQNPFDRPIEAVYLFPLPRRAAVDAMEIRIGERTIHAVIKKREEARALYNQARRSGQTAALLDQERPNIFTQSVANILPGEEIVVSLRYFDLLPYEDGTYDFTFPMVVGPRFNPGASEDDDPANPPSDVSGSQDGHNASSPAASGAETAHPSISKATPHLGVGPGCTATMICPSSLQPGCTPTLDPCNPCYIKSPGCAAPAIVSPTSSANSTFPAGHSVPGSSRAVLRGPAPDIGPPQVVAQIPGGSNDSDSGRSDPAPGTRRVKSAKRGPEDWNADGSAGKIADVDNPGEEHSSSGLDADGGEEPGSDESDSGDTAAPDAVSAPIHVPSLLPGQRSGHDIGMEIRIDAGATLQQLDSPSHAVDIERPGKDRALVRLQAEDAIPNKDFVLRYRLDGSAPAVVTLAHKQDAEGNFMLLVQPEYRPPSERVSPKEMIFVVDCSGSMSGEPIERVKEAMRYALENLNPLDNFQIIRFSNSAESFAPMPVPATPAMLEAAQKYVDQLSGNGGTIMLEGVRRALSYPEDPQRLRIVSFMTDGYIGNETEILAYMSRHLGQARLFSFGVGSSPNRFLLDKMAEFGRGGAQYVPLRGDVEAPVRQFYDRIRSPYLTDVQIDWGGLQVSEIYPRQVPDLFLGEPILLLGAYERAGEAEVILRGRLGTEPYEQRWRVLLPEQRPEGEAIGTLWARWKIEALSDQLVVKRDPALVEEITSLALTHNLVSAYTSFVAVDEWRRTDPVEPERVVNPVPLPDGVTMGAERPGHGGSGEVTGGVLGGVPGGVQGGVAGGVPGAASGEPTQRTMPYAVRVEGKEDVVQTESTQCATTISSEFISGLPVLGTDYQDVLTLAPGVTDIPASPPSPNIHGARDTVVTGVDGVNSEDGAEAVSSGSFEDNLTMESIEAIEVVTAGASAGFSAAQGGFVTIASGRASTQAGTEDLSVFPVFCTLKASSRRHHAGEPVQLYVVLKNLTGKAISIPVSLSVSDGSALFRILDPSWKEVTPPALQQAAALRYRALPPGGWIIFKITLNGEGGYKLDRPGLYQVVFLGSKLGLVDSTQLALRIEP